MKIVTVCTHKDGYFDALVESCKRHNHDLVVLGWNQTWKGFVWRQKLVLDYLEQLCRTGTENDLVCLVDAYDVVCLQDSDTIETRFRTFNKDIVVSSEFDTPFVKDHYYKRLYGPPCRGHKLNAGLFMGKCRQLIHFLLELQKLGQELHDTDDQRLMMTLYRKSVSCPQKQRHTCQSPPVEGQTADNKAVFDWDKNVAVDSQGLLFLNVLHPSCPQLFHLSANDKPKTTHRSVVVSNRSGLEPCFLHGPAQTDLSGFLELYGLNPIQNPFLPGHFWSIFMNNKSCYIPEIVATTLMLLVILWMAWFLFRKRNLCVPKTKKTTNFGMERNVTF